jgi:hypothetical protein
VTDKNIFVQELIVLAKDGKLITPKHDVRNILSPQSTFRTIICMSNDNFATFLQNGDYQIREYINYDPSHTPPYFEITPNDPAIVPGSGIPHHSTVPTTSCDRFIVISGVNQGWHLLAEASVNIQAKISTGDLTVLGDL